MNNKISVIVPIYKVESYLNQCIDSIIGQTYKNLEIVLVDDGSPDNCGKICDSYAQNDSRIKVIHKANGGLVSAWKAGVEASAGEYIGFVDGDDYIKPEMYEKMLEAALKNNADVVVTSFISADGADNLSGDLIYDENNKEELINNYLNFWQSELNIHPSRCDKIFKRNLVTANMQYCDNNIKLGEDFTLTSSVIFDCSRIILLKGKYYYYRVNNESMTRKYNNQLFEQSLLLFSTVKKIYKTKNIKENLFYNYFNYIVLLNLINERQSNLPFKLFYKKIRRICTENIWKSYFKNIKTEKSGKAILITRVLYRLNLCFLLALFLRIMRE